MKLIADTKLVPLELFGRGYGVMSESCGKQ